MNIVTMTTGTTMGTTMGTTIIMATTTDTITPQRRPHAAAALVTLTRGRCRAKIWRESGRFSAG